MKAWFMCNHFMIVDIFQIKVLIQHMKTQLLHLNIINLLAIILTAVWALVAWVTHKIILQTILKMREIIMKEAALKWNFEISLENLKKTFKQML